MRQKSFREHKNASALIMTVAFISLMISLAALFLTQTSAKLSESIGENIVNHARIACDQGLVHAKKAMLKDHAETTYTSWRSSYVQEFLPITSGGTPVNMRDNVATPKVFAANDRRLNVLESDRVSYLMAEAFQNNLKETDKWNAAYGYMYSIKDTANNSTSSRWHDAYFLNADGEIVPEPIAEYVVRYTVETSDENAKPAINPDYPGHPLTFDFNDPDNLNYLAYQAYIHRFAKSLRSMTSAPDFAEGGKQGYMTRAVGRFRPLFIQEKETVNAEGTTGMFTLDKNNQDVRFNYDLLFRGTGLTQYQPRDYTALTAVTPGKVFSYGQIVNTFKNGKSELGDNRLPRVLSPFVRGTRDAEIGGADDLPDYVSNVKDPNCPWRINVTTATLFSIQGMILGLSTHLESEANGKSWSRSGGSRTLDLFGKNYPEAFPLDIDAGKPIFLIGGDRDAGNNGINGTMFLPSSPAAYNYTSSTYLFNEAYLNSYWPDVGAALYQACLVAKSLWNFKEVPADGLCRITTTPGDLNANPKLMLAQLEEEFLRILGEDVSIGYSAAPSPQGTYSYMVNNGLLASAGLAILPDNGPNPAGPYVGYGDIGANSSKTINWTNSISETFKGYIMQRRKCSLPAHSNTRAMEYLLNDVRMSIFGTEALDFNKDGSAESTLNGWTDESGRKVWSWWFEGIPLAHSIGNDLKWLELPTWYRMSISGTAQLERWNGAEWEPWNSQISTFFAVNKAFLNASFVSTNSGLPIKPWSATGRFYVGHSNVFNAICRAEVFDLITERRVSQYTAEQFINIDPNQDDKLDDSYVIYRRSYGRTKFVGAQSE